MEKTATRPVFRTRRDQLRNGGRGALIGTAFGVMWFALGQSAVHGTARPAVLVGGLLMFAASAGAVVRLFLMARRTPATVQGAPAAAGGGGPKFLTVVLIEAAVLGVGNNYIRTGLHRPELMLTWSALVVGAHFFPMARSLRAPMLRWVGAAMLATVGLAALATLLPGATEDVWQSVPGIGCAAVLWAGAAYTGLRAGRKA
ncbi:MULTISPECIES: hypothetical protein [unclassified Streptomyces]|uniref:hypothetical protein n=1 Tax=unclassified Streptomyces TaxID=2593676 RepID=UPI00109E473B|nr:hypothetical protein [Streptomyces sp. A1136]THA59150.1 hypothetical protein E6R62_00375 [Streptomyces sp. A1136]